MLRSVWQPALIWTAAVVAVSLIGQPTVVCITPLAWLLAIPVGQQVVERSKNQRSDRSLVEAAICGGSLALLEGLLFLLVGYITPGASAVDRQMLSLLGLFTILIGVFACSTLAFVFAMRRQKQLEENRP